MDALQQCWRDGTLLEDQWKQNRNPRVPNPLSVASFSHRKQRFHQGGLLTILCSAIEKICVVAYVIFKCNQYVSLEFESYGHNWSPGIRTYVMNSGKYGLMVTKRHITQIENTNE